MTNTAVARDAAQAFAGCPVVVTPVNGRISHPTIPS
jgi:hypothetical protein